MIKENKKYVIYLAKYLGVALISGSVVHIGTLGGSSGRITADVYWNLWPWWLS